MEYPIVSANWSHFAIKKQHFLSSGGVVISGVESKEWKLFTFYNIELLSVYLSGAE